MKSLLSCVKKRLFTHTASIVGTVYLVTQPVLAKIPGNQEPTQGSDDDNILKTFFAYAYDIVLYGGGIGIAASTIYYFIHLWGVFQEVRNQKKEKSDLISDGVIGATLILLTIWGVNFSLGLLEKA
ncbi:TIGR03745 family integrating conjugative element membrane protein [Shewanella colwelliana]|uniref:TIGR03745 family integrating conjugative element membrane protein n=1 Tax=Shewanella colwelliana TaxID=23 RepID=UPI003735BB06